MPRKILPVSVIISNHPVAGEVRNGSIDRPGKSTAGGPRHRIPTTDSETSNHPICYIFHHIVPPTLPNPFATIRLSRRQPPHRLLDWYLVFFYCFCCSLLGQVYFVPHRTLICEQVRAGGAFRLFWGGEGTHDRAAVVTRS